MAELDEPDGQPLRVLGIRGLLLTKEGVRDKDRADARFMIELGVEFLALSFVLLAAAIGAIVLARKD